MLFCPLPKTPDHAYFKLLEREKMLQCYEKLEAPIDGVFLNIENVPDPVFAQKMVGDGFAIDPTSNIVYSPLDAIVTQLHPSKHAVTLQTSNGDEILIHVGIDTVKLNGNGFTAKVTQGDKVQKGQPLLEIDLDYLAVHAKSLITPVLLLDSENKAIDTTMKDGQMLKVGNSFYNFTSESVQNQNIETSKAPVESVLVKIINETGLHARPAAKIIHLVKTFNCEVHIIKNANRANAKSLVSLIGLGVEKNDNLVIEAKGTDALKALSALKTFLENLTENVESIEKKTTPKSDLYSDDKNKFSGICASEGIAIGKIYQLDKKELVIDKQHANPTLELEFLKQAIEQSIIDLRNIQNTLTTSEAEIFTAHIEILEDPQLLESTQKMIQEQSLNAAYVWNMVTKEAASKLAKMDNDYLSARAHDIEDVARRVLKYLIDDKDLDTNFEDIPDGSLLIADNLTPSETAKINKDKIFGFATVQGGTTSHVAILAKSLGIPALVAVNSEALMIESGVEAILNATDGLLEINFSNETFNNAIESIAQKQKSDEEDRKLSRLPAMLTDGKVIDVAANIANIEDAQNAAAIGCDGVGLLRSEFLFTGKKVAPNISDQLQVYQKISEQLPSDKPFVIRTLDVGGDKPLSYLNIPIEENPFLGERGIRVSLNHPELFKDQIRSILKISSLENIYLMFPMISRLAELKEAKAYVKEVQKELGIQKVKIGMMIEVPSAALMAETFAEHVDFFSIGANDLTQYVCAIDRGHPKLAKYADGLSPAVLKLIKMTCDAALEKGIWVGVCGGIASDPLAVPVLLGLGVKELSVSIPMIPKIKSTIRKYSFDACKKIASESLKLESAQAVRQFIQGSQYE